MPNWCSNYITLRHEDKTKVKALVEDMKEGNFLAHFIPEPKHFKVLNTTTGKWEYKDNEWYYWRTEHWGTKWEIELSPDDWEVDDKNELSFFFESAWSPPIGVYEKAHELGWDVSANYEELGADFAGQWVNGEDEWIDDISNLFESGDLPEWALDICGEGLYNQLDSEELIDADGNLLEEPEGKILKKYGEWGYKDFNDKMFNQIKKTKGVE